MSRARLAEPVRFRQPWEQAASHGTANARGTFPAMALAAGTRDDCITNACSLVPQPGSQ